MSEELEQVARERDLYSQLLELSLQDQPEVFLEKALSLFIECARAKRGYIELRDSASDPDSPKFSLLKNLDHEALMPGALSRTVIAETFATGETVITASAITDPRFQDRKSVRAQRLEAVLCAPIGTSPVVGVVYLQDRSEPGPFSSDDCKRAVLFARHVAAFAERLLSRRRRQTEDDPTQPFRRQLKIENIVGSSQALASVLQQVALVAPLQVGVLLTGACGTGKTQLARAIHDNRPRAAQPFIELNCAALPENLVESELFGVSAGAHSTAHRRTPGKLEAAEGGTLFLDEVSELPVHAQAKLLQFLQSGAYYPLGDTELKRASVRMIAATNADLSAEVAARRFREDLYYRINVFPLRVPLLEERRQDIPLLAARFCKATHETMGLPLFELSAGALLAVEHADWPGNVRELAHTVAAGVIRAHGEGATRIERRHLFPAAAGRANDSSLTFQDATRKFQRRFLSEALKKEGWNVASTARVLDITRTTVYNLMANLDVKRPNDN